MTSDTVGQDVLRVLVHTPEPTSSPALYVDALVEALTECGIGVTVVCPADHDTLLHFRSNPLVRTMESCARHIDPSLGIVGKIRSNARFLISSCWTLVKASRSGDIVNFQYALHLPFSSIFFLCAWLRGCRVVFTAHDPLPHKWLFPAPLRWLERAALGLNYRLSESILVHSEAGKRAIASHYPASAGKVSVIVHGPYKFTKAVQPRIRGEELNLLLFGALRENKGAHLAIQAVQRVHRGGGDVRLTVAGRVLNRKEQAYWDSCRTLIDEYPAPIHLLERFIPDEELPELFSANDCFLLPYDNFHSDSGVAFMALANGRPFLATPAGGLAQMMMDSKAGIRIEVPTVDAVEDAIRTALAMGPERLSEMGAAGEEWVMRECGWAKVASQMRAIFVSVRSASPTLRPSVVKA